MSDPRRPLSRNGVAPWAGALAGDDWPVLVGLPAVASLFVFAVPRLGWWALYAALLVYAAGFLAFERTRTTAAAYRQLSDVLARIPELSGVVPAGHSERVAQLAVAMAHRLDVRPADVTAIEQAVRCRDIGQVGVEEGLHAETGGAGGVARRSAAIVARGGRLAQIAPLIAPETPAAPAVARLRAIVDVAVAYETAVGIAGWDRERAVRSLAESGRAEVVGALAAVVGASV